MKHRIILPLLLLALCLLSACGKQASDSPEVSEQNTPAVQQPVIPEPVQNTLTSVSEGQVRQDVITRDEIQNCYSSRFSSGDPYELKEYALVKEQTNLDDKEDIVYCDLVVSNGQFEVSLSVRALYNYYDKGGWIMDEISSEVIEVIPISAPDAEKVIAYIQETELIYGSDPVYCFYQNENKVLYDGSLSAEGSGYDEENSCFIVRAAYTSLVQQVNGHYNMSFNGDEWDFAEKNDKNGSILVVDQISVDLSRAKGSYRFPANNFMGVPPGTLTIHELTGNSIVYTLIFDEEVPAGGPSIQQGERLSAAFDPFLCQFKVGVAYAYVDRQRVTADTTVAYDNEKGNWRSTWCSSLSPV